MSRSKINKLSFFFLSFYILSCASYKKQYADFVTYENKTNIEYKAKIDHTFYLIGDAGNAEFGKDLEHFNLLKKELDTVNKNTTILFLGDNIYEKGMPKKSNPERAIAEHRLNAQIELVKNSKGQPIFIPGNHDYYNNGIIGLKREENYIQKFLGKKAFLPNNGCPISKIDISENAVLIVVDSQWFLEDWNDNPTMNNDCEIKTRDKFFAEYERLIKKNTLKTTIVAIHHPMFSYGSHGGQFSLKAQLYPTGGTFPLPVIGSVINVLRKTSGISTQDMINPIYQQLKNRLTTITRKYENIIFVSGHEHNLQYIFEENLVQIVSGSGSKTSAAKVINGSQFSYGGKGYAKLVKYSDGATWIYYYTEKKGIKELLFKTEIEPKHTIKQFDFKPTFPDSVIASVYPEKSIEKSKAYVAFWGKHYRKYYGTKIQAPTVLLDTLYGGLTPFRKGGGNQSRSLRLSNPQGEEFVMRAVHKSATQYIQAVAYRNDYVKDEYEDTFTENLLLDIYTTAHPYAPLAVGALSNAANVFHSNPKLFFIPKQPVLGQFNEDFGDELYLVEERAASGHINVESFGNSETIISTDDLSIELRKSDDNYVDEESYIRARLFDMFIGDWDRHEDQWRWAAFEDGKKTVYKPVPRDRDQAFSKYDGFALGAITRIIPGLKLLQNFDKDIRNVKWFNHEPYKLDMAFIKEATFKDWKKQVDFLQKNITNEVIDSAFAQMPIEVQDETVIKIKNVLKSRLYNLPEIAKKYYAHLEKFPVVRGTDKDNWFEIIRLENGNTTVKTYNIKNNKKGSLVFNRTYHKKETSEIWVYGLNDDDIFNVSGVEKNVISLRLIGGQNNDVYNIESGRRVTIYDFKSKKNTFETDKGRKKLVDDYDINLFNYKKLKHSQNRIIPIIGYNPDDGIKLGVTNLLTVYGFERNPFTQQHTINASYYFATNGFDLGYNVEFANVFNNWNVLAKTVFTSPNFTRNFYGYGNDSKNYEDILGEDFHRVRLSTYGVSPELKKIGRMGAELKIGASFESIEIEKTDNRFINTLPIFTEQRKNYVGVNGSYFYQNFNETTFPTLGMAVSLEAGWKTNINTDKTENNGYITPAIGFNYNLTPNGKVILATKFKANFIIGENFKFYNSASIGGKDGLRGYNNNRFTGNTSYYQNTDIRYNITNIKTRLVPLQIGVFGGFDYGRVWYTGENSNDWKTSYGGGFWLNAAKLVNINISVFGATEGPYVRFGLGFGF